MHHLISSVNFVGSVRQQDDSSFGEILWRLPEGDGSCGDEDWRRLNARALQFLSSVDRESFLQSEPCAVAVRFLAEKKKASAANKKELKGGFNAGRDEASCNMRTLTETLADIASPHLIIKCWRCLFGRRHGVNTCVPEILRMRATAQKME